MALNYLNLNDGNKIPQIGLGVFKAEANGEAYNAVKLALQDGYRLLDTAALYGNEEDVGRAIKDSGVPRDEIFVTTKFWANDGLGYEQVQQACRESLRKLQLAHVDLYLVHSPGAFQPQARADTWRGMEKLKADGLSNPSVSVTTTWRT